MPRSKLRGILSHNVLGAFIPGAELRGLRALRSPGRGAGIAASRLFVYFTYRDCGRKRAALSGTRIPVQGFFDARDQLCNIGVEVLYAFPLDPEADGAFMAAAVLE